MHLRKKQIEKAKKIMIIGKFPIKLMELSKSFQQVYNSLSILHNQLGALFNFSRR